MSKSSRRAVLLVAPPIMLGLVTCVSLFFLFFQGRYENHIGQIIIEVNLAVAAVAAVWFAWARYRLRTKYGQGLGWRFVLKILGWGGVGSYVVAVAGLYAIQDHLLYANVSGSFEDCPRAAETHFNFLHENLPNGETLRAMVRETPGAKAWIVVFHGNAESACRGITYYTTFLSDLPLNWAILEFPGYRGDPKPPSQKRILASALDLFDYVAARDTAKLPIYSLGRSLGTGVATYVGSERPVAGVVLLSPYTSIADVGAYQYPMIPTRWFMHDTFPASDWAKKVRAPVLIFHGDQDRVIPFDMGKREATNFAHERMITVPGATHNLIRPEYETDIRTELREMLKF